MHTGSRSSSAGQISLAAVVCLALGGLFGASCKRPPASASTSSAPSPAVWTKSNTAPVLRADPNPVPSGHPNGQTTITWDTGSSIVGDVYLVDEGDERLFASDVKGSQSAPWITPGSTEFRLYDHTNYQLLAQLIVTMPSADASASSPPATPVSSASP